jgi:hypothetical protein
MKDYNFNIDEYNELELFSLIKYDENIRFATNEKIDKKIEKIFENLKSSDKDDNEKFQYEIFIYDIREKLIKYIEKYHSYHDKGNIIPKNEELLFNINNKTPTYPVGVINPIEKRTITRTLSIDTLFRDNYFNSSSSDFIWKLPGSQNKVISLKIASFEMSLNYNQISQKNKTNIMKIKISENIYTIEIEPGNYSSSQFVAYINNYFSETTSLQSIICSVDSITSKTTFSSNTTSFDIDFTVENDKYIDNVSKYQPHTLGTFLGFKKGSYSVTPEQNAISEASYGNGKMNYFFVAIDDYNNNYVSNTMITSSQQYIGNNMMARIQMNKINSNTIFNVTADGIFKTREYLGPVNIEKMHIQLLDKYGNVIDMNNNDISMTIELTQIYS